LNPAPGPKLGLGRLAPAHCLNGKARVFRFYGAGGGGSVPERKTQTLAGRGRRIPGKPCGKAGQKGGQRARGRGTKGTTPRGRGEHRGCCLHPRPWFPWGPRSNKRGVIWAFGPLFAGKPGSCFRFYGVVGMENGSTSGGGPFWPTGGGPGNGPPRTTTSKALRGRGTGTKTEKGKRRLIANSQANFRKGFSISTARPPAWFFLRGPL